MGRYGAGERKSGEEKEIARGSGAFVKTHRVEGSVAGSRESGTFIAVPWSVHGTSTDEKARGFEESRHIALTSTGRRGHVLEEPREERGRVAVPLLTGSRTESKA